VRTALGADRLKLIGDRELAAQMQTWLGLSSLAYAARPAA
jgi:hypothetical protein